jgi:hypothetical protein
MQNLHTQPAERLSDRAIYERVKRAGLAPNQDAFSRLCGRNPTWFSCIAASGRTISITALGLLAANVRWEREHDTDTDRQHMLDELHRSLVDEQAIRCGDRVASDRWCDLHPSAA